MASHSVTYDAEGGYVLTVYDGEVERTDIERTRSEAISLTRQHKCFKVLADLRKAEFNMGLGEVFNMPKETEKALSEKNLTPALFKRALLIKQNSKESMFFENVALNRGHNIKFFFDMEEAKAWLLED